MSAKPAASGSARRREALLEVVGLFLRLGTTAFGGPAAHIAMMREEVVARRRWLSDRQFLDLLALTQLIPGPNSTEMAIHLGYLRAGHLGLAAAGAAFILPAAIIVGALAWAYAAYGALPQAGWLLYGIKPVIIAVVLQALAGLARAAAGRQALAWAWAAGLMAVYLSGVAEIPLLLAGGGLYALVRWGWDRRSQPAPSAMSALPPWPTWEPEAAAAGAAVGAATAGAGAATAAPFSLGVLFTTFLKIGSVLYGSGYVLLAFLRGDFVERLGWLTDTQILDAVSVGQFTPGPVFTTATFVGYLLGGVAGAAVATVGIFLPSFFFVAAIQPLGPRLRRSVWTSRLLDGINLASLSLMAGVTLQLARTALVDPLTWALAVVALVALARWRVNSTYLILAGAAIGLGAHLSGLGARPG